MRIRKNAKLSSLLMSSHASGGEGVLQPHVCQLNQSPWDVMPFSLDPYLYAPLCHQLEEEGSINENGSLNDSMAAFESFSASMVGTEEAEEDRKSVKFEFDDMVIDVNGFEYEKEENKINKKRKKKKAKQQQQQQQKITKGGGLLSLKPFCQKNDGKGWHCKNETKEGFSLCDYHMFKCHEKAIARKGSAGITTRRARAAKKKTAGSNPYEFYYYSGFGPSWGKRRGGERNDGHHGNFVAAAAEDSNDASPDYTTPSSTVSSPINEEPSEELGSLVDDDYGNLDVVDEDEEDEQSGGDGGKRRTRKPVKARSLKSLM